jgi:orotidine-5'-phosphate decarboxylase
MSWGAGAEPPAPHQAAVTVPRAPDQLARHGSFGSRLEAAVAARESQVVVGIDPDPKNLWPGAAGRAAEARALLAQALSEAKRAALALEGHPGATEGTAVTARFDAAAAVLAHSLALIDAAAPACVAAKPQLAFFEQLGFAGWLALERVCAYARDAGLLLLADAKRGDVPSTAAAYARALTSAGRTPFGDVPGLGADAFTANPLLGRDALAPLIEGARASGGGVFVLVRTSNPGAADVLDLPLATGEPLWERLAVMVDELGEGEPGGLTDVGAVTGATAPEHLARMRELMPRTPFLLPGIGAQGGDVSTLAPAFAPGRAGGLVTASRSIAGAHEQHGGDPAEAARREAERLREAAWALA